MFDAARMKIDAQREINEWAKREKVPTSVWSTHRGEVFVV